jgi:hypothetical protein
MPNGAQGRSGQRFWAALCRFVLISIGALSVSWGAVTFPIFWRDARLDQTANSILGGERYKPELLQSLLADAIPAQRAWSRPEALRSVAIIQLQLVEWARTAKSARPSDPMGDQLGVSIRRSLSAAPADSFLWLALFSTTTMKDERRKEEFAYLRMSYLVGPHEGWVAALRNYIALAHFTELPQDVAEAAVTEFKDLVASGYYVPAVKILVGPGWPIRDMLLRRLEDAPEAARHGVARVADQLGYEIAVPGVERADPRPWR